MTKIMFEDEVSYNGRKVWVHANFKIHRYDEFNRIEVTQMRAYDMYPQSDRDEIDVDEKLISIVENLINDQVYGVM